MRVSVKGPLLLNATFLSHAVVSGVDVPELTCIVPFFCYSRACTHVVKKLSVQLPAMTRTQNLESTVYTSYDIL